MLLEWTRCPKVAQNLFGVETARVLNDGLLLTVTWMGIAPALDSTVQLNRPCYIQQNDFMIQTKENIHVYQHMMYYIIYHKIIYHTYIISYHYYYYYLLYFSISYSILLHCFPENWCAVQLD